MTPAGQTAVRHEEEAVSLFQSAYPRHRFISTDKDAASLLDGFISIGDVIQCAVEVKCRQTTLDELYHRFNNEWLVSYDKIANAREVCIALQIRLSGWLYLPLEKILLIQKICDERGNFLTKVRIESTTTVKNVNGGQKFGPNAFINIENATTIK